jgi:hypothetical protein
MSINKFIITKKGYYLLDEHGQVIVDDTGKVITFTDKDSANLFLKENKINGSIK